MRDLILMVRADESCHREVNHHFADLPSYETIEHTHVIINDDKNDLTFKKIEEKSDTEKHWKKKFRSDAIIVKIKNSLLVF